MSYQIPVFRAEVEAGIADAVRTKASIAYLAPVEAVGDADLASRIMVARATDGIPSAVADDDLFFSRDILATVCWNKNDDVMEKVDLFAARHTSNHKPFNFEHDQNVIIGHMITSEAVDTELNQLPEDSTIDELPAKFHVMDGSVIYRNVGDPERISLIDQTIAEIKAGGWCVSMECFFRGFDFALLGPDGVQRVIARNETTAHLTKYLRAYGGTGAYTDESTGTAYRVGRVLRNFTFCGKGLVKRPANPDSDFVFVSASFYPTVYTLSEPVVINDPTLETQMNFEELLAEARATILRLNTELETLKNAGTEATIAGLKAEVTAKEAAVAALNAQVATITAVATENGDRAAAADTALAAANTELASLRAEKVVTSRTAVATQKGIAAEKVAELVKTLAGLDDAAFAATVEIVAASRPKVASDEVAIDNAVVETDPALVVATEETVSDRAAMADYFEKTLLLASRK